MPCKTASTTRHRSHHHRAVTAIAASSTIPTRKRCLKSVGPLPALASASCRIQGMAGTGDEPIGFQQVFVSGSWMMRDCREQADWGG